MVSLNGKTIAIILTDGFETVEMTQPREALETAGATTHLIAPEQKFVTPNQKVVRGLDFPEWGQDYPVNRYLSEANPADYDALFIPGGIINPDLLRMDPDAVAFVKAFFDVSKPVASLCHGPFMLIEADVIKGRTLTSWPSLHTDLVNAGARWVDEAVVRDGNLVTSRNPGDIPNHFNPAMLTLFSEV